MTAARISRTSRPCQKKPGTNPNGEFAFFNVVYEDGSQRSNRRVPAELIGGLDRDEPAHGYILEQDREIAEKSGRLPLAIKSISRVGAKKKQAARDARTSLMATDRPWRFLILRLRDAKGSLWKAGTGRRPRDGRARVL